MKIAGRNISDFSAYLIGDYLQLVAYPPLKDVNKNDWVEHNGTEYDFSNIILKEKTIDLFFVLNNKNKYREFIDYVCKDTYQIWEFENIQLSLNLRVIKIFDYKVFGSYCECKISVSDDFPLHNYIYKVPNIDNPNTNFLLNGLDFSKYGIIPLFENQNTIADTREIKEHLKIDSSIITAVQYGQHSNFFKERILELYCFMKLPIIDFWQNYNAFLYDLTRPKEQVLTTLNIEQKIIYKKSNVKHFSIEKEKIQIEFIISVIDTRQ